MEPTIIPEGIDSLILPAVQILNDHGFKTFESCQGGEGHCFAEPTIRFEGTEFDLIRAYNICELYGLPVWNVRRVYRKTPLYRDSNTLNSQYIGEAWESPFNEITFLRELLFTLEEGPGNKPPFSQQPSPKTEIV